VFWRNKPSSGPNTSDQAAFQGRPCPPSCDKPANMRLTVRAWLALGTNEAASDKVVVTGTHRVRLPSRPATPSSSGQPNPASPRPGTSPDKPGQALPYECHANVTLSCETLRTDRFDTCPEGVTVTKTTFDNAIWV
jgi:hypothetical protein